MNQTTQSPPTIQKQKAPTSPFEVVLSDGSIKPFKTNKSAVAWAKSVMQTWLQPGDQLDVWENCGKTHLQILDSSSYPTDAF